MRNIQSRTIKAPPTTVADLLAGLGGPDDQLWPSSWPPQRFDRPPGVGARGGHSSIRYTVTEWEPGRRARYTFDHGLGIDGWHEFRLTADGPDTCTLTHEIRARTRGKVILSWPFAVRWLHEALVADLFDNAQRHCEGVAVRPARWSPWVRLIRAARRRSQPVA
ncbi:hypothetical protein Lfu02_75190 [Longispora fulva]|uniref:SRPBCC family protein n=1 Tax=Longispora fulva TaxID=619741 RepID=A0A8J7G770_9ACTN|nr:SRPBCC family protein [Longispora fulva]MBG6134255.1 hypothetical protein [Longispora fulva]GIG63147.1 hypothetical protein Lfu02_75190 [Longispora fulva]